MALFYYKVIIYDNLLSYIIDFDIFITNDCRDLGHVTDNTAAILLEIEKQGLMQLVESSLGVVPPFRAPDTANDPAEVDQHHLAQPIAVTRRCRAVVRRS